MSHWTAKRQLIYISSSEEEGGGEDNVDFDLDDDRNDEDQNDDEEDGSKQNLRDTEKEIPDVILLSDLEYENTEKESPDVVVLSDMEYEDEWEGEDLRHDHLSNSAICLLPEEIDRKALTMTQCKEYLRKHGLLVTGTMAVCLQRIKEHSRLKSGNAEALYPRSSFIINCTGDVCKGDVVLFKRKVCRGKHLPGKITIAGRVVKESYGADRQQHTFTIEVLWSRGTRRLPPLSPMLVKGRNLYRLQTFRQLWRNEAERSSVLAEKHQRGAAARLIMNEEKKLWSVKKGTTTCQSKPAGTISKGQGKGHKNSCHRPGKALKTMSKGQKKGHNNPCRHPGKASKTTSKWQKTGHKNSFYHPGNASKTATNAVESLVFDVPEYGSDLNYLRLASLHAPSAPYFNNMHSAAFHNLQLNQYYYNGLHDHGRPLL